MLQMGSEAYLLAHSDRQSELRVEPCEKLFLAPDTVGSVIEHEDSAEEDEHFEEAASAGK